MRDTKDLMDEAASVPRFPCGALSLSNSSASTPALYNASYILMA